MRHRPALLTLLAAALLAGAPLAAQPAPTGPAMLVDPAAYEPQTPLAAATDSTGNLLVVWVGSGGELRGRIFDSSHKPLRPAFTLVTGTVWRATLAPAAPDGFLLVWNAPADTNGQMNRLLARRLSPTGRPRGEVIQVRSPTLNTIESIRAASGPGGSFTVAWSDWSLSGVFFRSFDPAGRALAPEAPVPGRSGHDQRSAPAVVVLDDGEIRIGWNTFSAPSLASAAWAGRFSRSGVPLAAPVQLTPPNVEWPLVTFGPQGGSLASWDDGGARHVRAFAPDGSPFAEHQLEERLSQSQATAARDGTFVLSSGNCQRLLEADGTPRGGLGCQFDQYSGDASVLTETANGGFARFWSQEIPSQVPDGEGGDEDFLFGQFLATRGPGTLQIERARFVVAGNASQPLTLRILRRDGTEGAVSVDYRLTGAASGSGTVTFPDGDSAPKTLSIPVAAIPGNDRILVTLSQPTGGAVLAAPARAVVEIRDDAQPSPLLSHAQSLGVDLTGDANVDVTVPGLAATPNGEFALAWAYGVRDGYRDPQWWQMRGQLFDAAGQPAATRLEACCSAWSERVTLAMHPEGDLMMFWQGEEYRWVADHDQLVLTGFAQRFDAHGAAVGKAVALGVVPDGAAPLPKGRFVVVGRHALGEGLFAHFLSTNGLDRRSPVLITSDVLQPGSRPAVASDASGRSVVVWAVAPTGASPAGIFARRFDALGTPLGAAIRVSQWEGQDLAPSVATDPRGNFVVAWQRSSDGGIYARVFNAGGAPLRDEIAVNSQTQGNERSPAVALTGDGRFAVLWVSQGVHGQLFAGAGTLLGGAATVDPYGGRPAIVWSERGFFVAINFVSGDIYEDFYGYIHASILPLRNTPLRHPPLAPAATAAAGD